jgi:hypothetical protein
MSCAIQLSDWNEKLKINSQLPNDECGNRDGEWLYHTSNKAGKWIGILSYPYRDEANDTAYEAAGCQSVLDRVKRAMMVGASAIIILVLNPRVVKEVRILVFFNLLGLTF